MFGKMQRPSIWNAPCAADFGGWAAYWRTDVVVDDRGCEGQFEVSFSTAPASYNFTEYGVTVRDSQGNARESTLHVASLCGTLYVHKSAGTFIKI